MFRAIRRSEKLAQDDLALEAEVAALLADEVGELRGARAEEAVRVEERDGGDAKREHEDGRVRAVEQHEVRLVEHERHVLRRVVRAEQLHRVQRSRFRAAREHTSLTSQVACQSLTLTDCDTVSSYYLNTHRL